MNNSKIKLCDVNIEPPKSSTPTRTPTRTPVSTKTPTKSYTPTKTLSKSITSSRTPTKNSVQDSTPTPTQTITLTSTPTLTPSESRPPDLADTPTPTPTPTPTQTDTPTQTPTPTTSEKKLPQNDGLCFRNRELTINWKKYFYGSDTKIIGLTSGAMWQSLSIDIVPYRIIKDTNTTTNSIQFIEDEIVFINTLFDSGPNISGHYRIKKILPGSDTSDGYEWLVLECLTTNIELIYNTALPNARTNTRNGVTSQVLSSDGSKLYVLTTDSVGGVYSDHIQTIDSYTGNILSTNKLPCINSNNIYYYKDTLIISCATDTSRNPETYNNLLIINATTKDVIDIYDFDKTDGVDQTITNAVVDAQNGVALIVLNAISGTSGESNVVMYDIVTNTIVSKINSQEGEVFRQGIITKNYKAYVNISSFALYSNPTVIQYKYAIIDTRSFNLIDYLIISLPITDINLTNLDPSATENQLGNLVYDYFNDKIYAYSDSNSRILVINSDNSTSVIDSGLTSIKTILVNQNELYIINIPASPTNIFVISKYNIITNKQSGMISREYNSTEVIDKPGNLLFSINNDTKFVHPFARLYVINSEIQFGTGGTNIFSYTLDSRSDSGSGPGNIPTPTPTLTPTLSPTPTQTITLSPTPTISITSTNTPTITITPTLSPSISITPTNTPTITVTPSDPRSTNPTNISAIPGNNNVSITWDAPEVFNSAHQRYFVQYKPAGTPDSAYQLAGGISFKFTEMTTLVQTVTNLDNDADYDFRVGTGSATLQSASSSITSTPNKALTSLQAPRNLTAINNDATITLTWDPIQIDDIITINYPLYFIQYKQSTSSRWEYHPNTVKVNDIFAFGKPTISLTTNLVNNIDYDFRVGIGSTNAVQIPEQIIFSAVASAKPVVAKPSPVRDLKTILIGENFIDISWNAPEFSGDSSLSNYILEYSADGGTNWTTYNDTILYANINLTRIEKLLPNTNYNIRIKATNNDYESSWTQITAKTNDVVTIALSSLRASISPTSSSTVDLSWDVTNVDNITNYVIDYKYVGTSNWIRSTQNISTKTKTAKVTNLNRTSAYIFRIGVTNKIGQFFTIESNTVEMEGYSECLNSFNSIESIHGKYISNQWTPTVLSSFPNKFKKILSDALQVAPYRKIFLSSNNNKVYSLIGTPSNSTISSQYGNSSTTYPIWRNTYISLLSMDYSLDSSNNWLPLNIPESITPTIVFDQNKQYIMDVFIKDSMIYLLFASELMSNNRTSLNDKIFLYVSYDKGITFNKISIFGDSNALNGINHNDYSSVANRSLNNDSDYLISISGDGKIILIYTILYGWVISKDGGGSFSKVNIPADLNSYQDKIHLQVSDDGTTFMATGKYGVRSDSRGRYILPILVSNNGIDWTYSYDLNVGDSNTGISKSLPNLQMSKDGSVAVVSLQLQARNNSTINNYKFFVSLDRGETWKKLSRTLNLYENIEGNSNTESSGSNSDGLTFIEDTPRQFDNTSWKKTLSHDGKLFIHYAGDPIVCYNLQGSIGVSAYATIKTIRDSEQTVISQINKSNTTLFISTQTNKDLYVSTCLPVILEKPATPPQSPINILASNITSTSMDISWEYPTPLETESPVADYIVEVNGSPIINDEISAKTSVNIKNLLPNTMYRISVKARNDVGIGLPIILGVNTLPPKGTTVFQRPFDSRVGDVLVTTDDGKMFVGKNIKREKGSLTKGIYFYDDVLYVTSMGVGLGISKDYGATYLHRDTSHGLGDNNINDVYAYGNAVYVATWNGLSVSTDGGITFKNYRHIPSALQTTNTERAFNYISGPYIYRVFISDGFLNIISADYTYEKIKRYHYNNLLDYWYESFDNGSDRPEHQILKLDLNKDGSIPDMVPLNINGLINPKFNENIFAVGTLNTSFENFPRYEENINAKISYDHNDFPKLVIIDRSENDINHVTMTIRQSLFLINTNHPSTLGINKPYEQLTLDDDKISVITKPDPNTKKMMLPKAPININYKSLEDTDPDVLKYEISWEPPPETESSMLVYDVEYTDDINNRTWESRRLNSITDNTIIFREFRMSRIIAPYFLVRVRARNKIGIGPPSQALVVPIIGPTPTPTRTPSITPTKTLTVTPSTSRDPVYAYDPSLCKPINVQACTTSYQNIFYIDLQIDIDCNFTPYSSEEFIPYGPMNHLAEIQVNDGPWRPYHTLGSTANASVKYLTDSNNVIKSIIITSRWFEDQKLKTTDKVLFRAAIINTRQKLISLKKESNLILSMSPNCSNLIPTPTSTPTRSNLIPTPTSTPTRSNLIPTPTSTPTRSNLIPTPTRTPTRSNLIPTPTPTPTQTKITGYVYDASLCKPTSVYGCITVDKFKNLRYVDLKIDTNCPVYYNNDKLTGVLGSPTSSITYLAEVQVNGGDWIPYDADFSGQGVVSYGSNNVLIRNVWTLTEQDTVLFRVAIVDTRQKLTSLKIQSGPVTYNAPLCSAIVPTPTPTITPTKPEIDVNLTPTPTRTPTPTKTPTPSSTSSNSSLKIRNLVVTDANKCAYVKWQQPEQLEFFDLVPSWYGGYVSEKYVFAGYKIYISPTYESKWQLVPDSEYYSGSATYTDTDIGISFLGFSIVNNVFKVKIETCYRSINSNAEVIEKNYATEFTVASDRDGTTLNSPSSVTNPDSLVLNWDEPIDKNIGRYTIKNYYMEVEYYDINKNLTYTVFTIPLLDPKTGLPNKSYSYIPENNIPLPNNFSIHFGANYNTLSGQNYVMFSKQINIKIDPPPSPTPTPTPTTTPVAYIYDPSMAVATSVDLCITNDIFPSYKTTVTTNSTNARAFQSGELDFIAEININNQGWKPMPLNVSYSPSSPTFYIYDIVPKDAVSAQVRVTLVNPKTRKKSLAKTSNTANSSIGPKCNR